MKDIEMKSILRNKHIVQTHLMEWDKLVRSLKASNHNLDKIYLVCEEKKSTKGDEQI